MTTLDRGEEKLKFEDLPQHYDQNDISGYCSLNSEKAESPVTPNISRTSTTAAVPTGVSNAGSTPPSLDEKRMRREIANSNERRRMQSINAGFQSLRTLLPHHEGEKLSKAAILQQTAEYIYQLEQERTQLLTQNCHLKRIISQHEGDLASNSPPSPGGGGASKKRKTTDSSDDDVSGNDEFMELKIQLDRERALRIHLEEKVQRLESLYPIATTATAVTSADKIHEISTADQITIQFKEEPKDETMILSTSNVGVPVTSFETSRRTLTEMQSSPATASIVNVVTTDAISAAKAQRVAVASPAASGATSVILQPVTHDESLLPSAIINGHQYAVSPAAAVGSTTCASSMIGAGKQAKPRVEVERLPSPTSVALVTTIAATRLTNTCTTNSSTPLVTTNASIPAEQISAKVYLTSTSRQNLETIVEAIRHLEGDSMFDSAASSTTSSNGSSNADSSSSIGGSANTSPTNQEAPLALTKRTSSQTVLQVDMNPFLRFHSSSRHHTNASAGGTVTTSSVVAEQQQRPGVIVVKQQT